FVAESKRSRLFVAEIGPRKDRHPRRARWRARIQRRLARLADLWRQFHPGSFARHRTVPAPASQLSDRRRSPDIFRAIPKHERTATNRCIREDRQPTVRFFERQEIPAWVECNFSNRSGFDSIAPVPV